MSIIEGVVNVIERLEADRQYVVEALHKERKRKRFLENEVDSISQHLYLAALGKAG